MKHTNYSKNAFKENIIYPDTFKEEGHYAPYFYLHGTLEKKAGYDCATFSARLLSRILRFGPHLATVKMGDKNIKSLVISYVDKTIDRVKGLIFALDDIESLKEILYSDENCNYIFIGGDTPDEFIKLNYPDLWKMLIEWRNKME